MNSNDNEQTALEAGLTALDLTNKHLVVLTSIGLTQEAIGAENTWLDQAVRVAMIPAETAEAAALKIKLLSGNMSGWAVQASKANGLVGAAALVMGAVMAEAHEWGLDTETADTSDAERQAQVWAVDIDPGILAAYRKNAKPRRLAPALKACKAAVARVDAMLARRKDDGLLADAPSSLARCPARRGRHLDRQCRRARAQAARLSGLSRPGRSRPLAVRKCHERRLQSRLQPARTACSRGRAAEGHVPESLDVE